MTDSDIRREEAQDRIVVHFDPGSPIELNDLTGSFAALARMYERHYRPEGESPAPKLYVTKLETGSIIAEIAPYAVLLGAIISTMDSAMIVSDFVNRVSAGIKAFSDPTRIDSAALPDVLMPSRDDATDLREFVKPLTGKNGAKLGVKHARYESHDGGRRTIVEYDFDENQLNRAVVNIDHALANPATIFTQELALEFQENSDGEASILKEVMLFFEQASRKPGKESGRTGDRGIIPDVSPRSLPVYFRKSFQNLKDQMVRGDVNPLTNFAFVVDVHVQRVNGKPKAYIVTDVHQVLPLDEASL